MQYRTLGRTGIKVSPYALGTLMFATSMGNDPRDSARIIHKAIDAGINVVDTADAYGDSEEVVGKALEGRRDDVVLATKFSRPIGQDPNHQGASRRWIVTAVENSLRRLRTDHIDLYQLHRPDPDTDIEETLAALTDLIRSGKVRAIGASQTSASPTPASPAHSSARGPSSSSTTCLPAWTSPSPTTCSTASTRSSRPAPTSVLSTRPINRRPSRTRAFVAGPSPHAPQREISGASGGAEMIEWQTSGGLSLLALISARRATVA